MILTDKHIEIIKTAALAVDFGKITITSGTDNHLDIIVEHRIRLPKEPDKSGTATQTRPGHKALNR